MNYWECLSVQDSINSQRIRRRKELRKGSGKVIFGGKPSPSQMKAIERRKEQMRKEGKLKHG